MGQHAATPLYLLLKWVQCCAAVACGAVYAAVLSVLSVSVWLTGVRLVTASQAAVGEMCGDRERWRRQRWGTARESVISFRLFSFWHASSPPYCLSASADDWQRNCSATDRPTSRLRACLCTASIWMAYASVNTWENAMPPLCEISISSQWWSDVAVLAYNGACCLLTALCPLHSLTDSTLAIKMLCAFQKSDFTNGKTASAFLQFHIWRP